MDPRLAVLQRTAAERTDVIGLAGGLPAPELMPCEALAAALARVARRGDGALQYAWPEGEARLRAWVAARLADRGADVGADDVIITSGAQQALSLIGAAHRGRQIAVGEATYHAAITAFQCGGADVVVTGTCTRYVMPGVANPIGREVGPPLYEGAAAIADEAYAELRFDGAVPRPLVAGARERVWHVGTLSKTLSPGLRVGWLVPPRAARAQILEAKEAADLQTASLTQAGVAELLATFDYDAHVTAARAAYARRCDAMCTALRRALPGVPFDEPEGGFSVWLELDTFGDDAALLAEGIAGGVAFDPGALFRPRRVLAPLALRVSFSAAPIDQLAEGARRLAAVIERFLGGRASRRRN